MDKVIKFASGVGVVLVAVWIAQILPNPLAKLAALTKKA